MAAKGDSCPVMAFPLAPKIQHELRTKFASFDKGLVEVGQGRYLLPQHCRSYLDKYAQFRFRPDDVVVMTFPRSGTTWTQEMVWCMTHDLDFTTAINTPLKARSPFLEFDSIYRPDFPLPSFLVDSFLKHHPDEDLDTTGVFLAHAESVPSPRVIKTHLPFSLLPSSVLESCKVIYVARHPGDVCVSYYHQQRLIKSVNFKGDLEEFLDLWCRDLVMLGPYWSHLSEAWAKRTHPNLLWLYYEDMNKDPLRELQRLDHFLATGLTADELLQVAQHSSFANMKARPATNHSLIPESPEVMPDEAGFVRKGATGDWVTRFTPQMKAKFQAWVESGSKAVGEVPPRYTQGQKFT